MSYSIGFLRFCKQVGTRQGASPPLPSALRDEGSPGCISVGSLPKEKSYPRCSFFFFSSEGAALPAPGQQQSAALAVLASDSLLSQGLLPLQS